MNSEIDLYEIKDELNRLHNVELWSLTKIAKHYGKQTHQVKRVFKFYNLNFNLSKSTSRFPGAKKNISLRLKNEWLEEIEKLCELTNIQNRNEFIGIAICKMLIIAKKKIRNGEIHQE